MDATDARAHVSLGKLLVQQRRYDEARALYEEGSTATGAVRCLPFFPAWLTSAPVLPV